MSEPLHCTLADLAPVRRDRAGWNQALIGVLSRANSVSLVLDLGTAPRLDSGLLASLGPVEQDVLRRGGSLRLETADAELRQVVRLANLERLLVDAAGVNDLSCQVTYSDQEVAIVIQRNAGQNPRMTTPLSYAWLGRVSCQRVGVDLGEVAHINSVLVAWLLQLGQAAKPASFALFNVSRQVAIQLNQLRLNHLLTVHEAP
jgi:anti-anti-sigma regulatory factor